LIPSSYNIDYGTVKEQKEQLMTLQEKTPSLRVPSVLEAVSYWFRLRPDKHKPLKGSGMGDKTYIRHFDLPDRSDGGWLYVPRSVVVDDGEPRLGRSGGDDRGRVAVG
jgi:hypothetical protein